MALSPVAVDLLRSMNAHDVEVGELARRIALDQAIAARVLRVANSSFYALSGRIATIHDAIVVLGLSTVRSLVMAFAVKGVFPVAPDSGFDARRFWRHSLGVAVCAQALARPLRRNAEALFIAGLLHDIGHLAMVVVVPEVFRAVSDESQAAGVPMFLVERTLLGYDHATLGAALARRWNFPAEVVTAIGFHHAPDEGEPTVLSDLVHYANVLVHALLPDDAAHEPEEPVSARVLDRLALDEQTTGRVMARAEEHFGSLQPLFD
ncbi:MAG: HDOD domain-containing protein [Zoogloea sp.]|nr:HDOD domain-containing protein [Zoogloea sp.]